MVKRKADESAFEFRQRKKKYKFKKAHEFDDEKNYWKNASKQASREQKGKIQDLFAKAGASSGIARAGYSAYELSSFVPSAASAVEGMFGAAGVEAGLSSAVYAGAALGGGAAIAGAAGLGYLAGNVIGSLFTQTNSIISGMPGTYQGKFALSAAAAFKGLRDKYQKKGAVYIIENYGSVADPDCVYVGHTTWNATGAAWSISVALIRKLFRVGARIDVVTPYEELPLSNIEPLTSTGFSIVYRTLSSNGTVATHTHPIPNDSSISTITDLNIDGFKLFDNIIACLTAANTPMLSKVLLFETAGTEKRLVYQMDMAKEVLHIAMSSHMVVQNRTKSAAGSTEVTQVDAQPLKGPVFEFSTGVPKLKASNPNALNYVGPQGVILVRGAELPGTDALSYKEPPVKSTFQNVVKTGYTRLNPGALKSMTAGVDASGYFQNVIQKMKFSTDSIVYDRCFGKSQMVVLEEELNSGSANNITVTYECQHIAGAEFITTLNPNCQPGYTSAVLNNLPA